MSEAAVMNHSEASVVARVASRPEAEARRLRVLHVHAGNMFGGVESMLLTQVRERERCPALESSFALCFEGRFSQELADAGASVHQLGQVRMRQPLSVRRARRQLKDLLQREPFDVAITHSCWSQAIFGPAVRAQSTPLVFYMHAPAGGKHWQERLARRTQPDLVLSNSNFTAATLSQLFPRVPNETVYCPVAPPPPNLQGRRETRAELQTPDEATVIVQVSRMEHSKGQAQHLEALSLLKDVPNWICWQIGGAQRPEEVEYEDQLKRLAAERGIAERVRFLGQRSDVARFLGAADVYCQPNRGAEPFGITFVEALYAGLPVVTTTHGGGAEIMDDSCAVLVPPGDARALSAVLRRLIQDPALRKKLGAAGPARAHALCDPAARLKQFHHALASLVLKSKVQSPKSKV